MTPKSFGLGSLLMVYIWWESTVLAAKLKLIEQSLKEDCIISMRLQQVIGLSNHKNIKVGHCASSLVDSFCLSCGIRLTPQELKADRCFLCQIVKKPILLFLPSINNHSEGVQVSRLYLLDYQSFRTKISFAHH